MKRIFVTAALTGAAFLGGATTAELARARSGDESPYAQLAQLARVLVLVENDYVDPVDRSKLLEGAIKGMVAELDPHSAYMPADDNALFHTETEGKFGGVGLEVEQRDDRVIVLAPIEGSPAERAGIKPGDRIVAIAGEGTRGSNLEKLVRKMRGDPGTTIEIEVLSPGAEKERRVVLTREIIRVKSVTAKRLAGDVVYLRIKQFQATTHDEMLLAIGRVREGGAPIASVILDLRTNPGGLVDQAVGVADELLTEGVIYTTRARGKVIDEVKASGGGALAGVPAVVLVNEYSASASELVAGALQDNGRATIVGATTFGKGSVQSILSLPNGAGMRLTTMRFFTPRGRVIQAQGITPDVVVEPSGVATPGDPIFRERDTPGYLPPHDGARLPPPRPPVPTASASASAETKPEGLELGVAKSVPDDPSSGPDRILAAGYQLARKLAATKR